MPNEAVDKASVPETASPEAEAGTGSEQSVGTADKVADMVTAVCSWVAVHSSLDRGSLHVEDIAAVEDTVVAIAAEAGNADTEDTAAAAAARVTLERAWSLQMSLSSRHSPSAGAFSARMAV
jgi:hypothetical protein